MREGRAKDIGQEWITRAGPELSPVQHQNRANKRQGGVMLRAGWRAQQAKQRTDWEATQKIRVAGITAGQGNGAADDKMEGRTRSGRRLRQRAEEGDW